MRTTTAKCASPIATPQSHHADLGQVAHGVCTPDLCSSALGAHCSLPTSGYPRLLPCVLLRQSPRSVVLLEIPHKRFERSGMYHAIDGPGLGPSQLPSVCVTSWGVLMPWTAVLCAVFQLCGHCRGHSLPGCAGGEVEPCNGVAHRCGLSDSPFRSLRRRRS